MNVNLQVAIGYHGCDLSVKEKILAGEPMLPSTNSYDWLGSGIYFWEDNYNRAINWATESRKIKIPAVIGAKIQLGNCLDLTKEEHFGALRLAYRVVKETCESSGKPMPRNRNVRGRRGYQMRDLDCSVINQLNLIHKEQGLPEYDTVRSVFEEGEHIYPGSGFYSKTHIQICVRNPACIVEYFDPEE